MERSLARSTRGGKETLNWGTQMADVPGHLFTGMDLWQFDGWSENGMGGIYFYTDWHAETPWGATRPDYGREEVRAFIHDNAMMWYSRAFGNVASSDVEIASMQTINLGNESEMPSHPPQRDGFPWVGTIKIGGYSVLIFSQDQ